MNTAVIQAWMNLTEQTRRNIFEETAADIGLPAAAVEKDWWAMQESMFYNPSLSFDKLIERMRELKKRINNL